jgi:hypothetical protein
VKEREMQRISLVNGIETKKRRGILFCKNWIVINNELYGRKIKKTVLIKVILGVYEYFCWSLNRNCKIQEEIWRLGRYR